MRLVLDTNILIAAFISHGSCAELLEHTATRHEVYTARILLQEFERILTTKCRITRRDAVGARRLLADRFTVVTPVALGAPVCRDSDDDRVIGTALAGRCAYIVSGDRDLLVLRRYRDIAILGAQEFWRFEAELEA